MTNATAQWLAAATYAKVCGATDPAAVVLQAAEEWAAYSDAHFPLPWSAPVAHLRRIEELSVHGARNGVNFDLLGLVGPHPTAYVQRLAAAIEARQEPES